MYALTDNFRPFAQQLDAWRTNPPASGGVPCDLGTDWSLALGNISFTNMLRRMARDAADGVYPKRETASWLLWCLQEPEVVMAPPLRVAFTLVAARMMQNRPIRVFRLWKNTPRAILSDSQEQELRGFWQGQVPRAERMLTEGQVERVQ